MTDEYLHLSEKERGLILSQAAAQMNKDQGVLEKDIWVCWTLQTLFSMPNRHPMAFKGGTSLSKVYGAIDRFSEDVDVTLDYRHFDERFDPFSATSKNQVKRFGDTLKQHVATYSHNTVAPFLRQNLSRVPGTSPDDVEVDPEGEKIWITYPSAAERESDYMAGRILIEFGGRNVIDPNEKFEVAPVIEEFLPDLTYPKSNVVVLSGERTFWEKATLIHSECNRNGLKKNIDRLARHWYDLSQLAGHSLGERAIRNRRLLEDVVQHKKTFFHAGYADYDACLDGGFRLIPNAEVLEVLERDYKEMLASGMMSSEAPTFDSIIEDLRQLEETINTT